MACGHLTQLLNVNTTLTYKQLVLFAPLATAIQFEVTHSSSLLGATHSTYHIYKYACPYPLHVPQTDVHVKLPCVSTSSCHCMLVVMA